MFTPTPQPNIKASIAQVKGRTGSLIVVNAQFCKERRPNFSTVGVPNCHKNLPATVPFKRSKYSLSLARSESLKPTPSCSSLAVITRSTVSVHCSVLPPSTRRAYVR